MLKNANRQQTTFNDRKNIKTDINNEEKLAKKKHKATTKETLKNHTNVGKQHKKHKLTQKCKKTNRRQKLDKAQKPPHTTNAKPATARQR